MVGFQPLVPIRPLPPSAPIPTETVPPAPTAPQRPKKVFQGLAVSNKAQSALPTTLPASAQRHSLQGNSHLPRGSIPSGARPPPSDLGQSQGTSVKTSLLKKEKREEEVKRRKTAIPSFALDDSSSSSSPSWLPFGKPSTSNTSSCFFFTK